MKIFFERNYKIIIVAILAFMALVSVLNAWNDSAIFDETAHIPAAYSYLKFHDMRLNPEHPPLIKDLAALPLMFMRLNFDTGQKFWAQDVNGQWDAGYYFLYQAGNNPDKIIFWARLPIVILSLILGWFIFKWARELAGTAAGIFALILYAFDPNILGHNHFVTTDLGIAAFMAFAFYYYLKFINEPTGKHMLLAGFFLGLMQLAKFSAVVAFPIIGLVTILYPLVKINRRKETPDAVFKLKKLCEYIWKGAAVFAISLVVVWGVYAINIYNMPKEKLAETINYYFSPTDTNKTAVLTNRFATTLNDRLLTRPLSEYVLGVAMVFKRVEGGNGAYFFGQVSSNGFPAYFPTVFAIKEPLPSLFFMLFALFFVLTKIFATFCQSIKVSAVKLFRNTIHYLRTSIVEISLFSFILLYTYISITGNLNIGFRHLFPILPFIYILVAKNVTEFLTKKKFKPDINEPKEKLIERTKEIRHETGHAAWAYAIITGYLVAGTVFAYPYYMSYFNEAAGGPKNGYHYATDSNADWGQDLKRLHSFLDDHLEIGAIRVDYFGGGNAPYYIGDKYAPWWDSKRPIEAGWYAISTNFLEGSLYDATKKDSDTYRWIWKLNKKPAYQAGTSMLIYNISTAEAAEINNN